MRAILRSTLALALTATCLTAVPDNATANGTRLVIWTCNGGANQRWTLT
ncbi:RICIN domain-containing protein [Nonomuraea sp. NPDC052265]